jgi:hypothetical protein
MIRVFPDPAEKIKYLPHGRTKSDGEDAKSELRNGYLDNPRADILVVIDADEFYHPEDLESIKELFSDKQCFSVTLPQVHFWKHERQFITGGYYDVSHTRIFRNIPGMKYASNHNVPELGGSLLIDQGRVKCERVIEKSEDNTGFVYKGPCCFHLGFVKPGGDTWDKAEYYVNRGEEEMWPETTQCRRASFNNILPDNCIVRPWAGAIPSVLTFKREG